MARSRKTLEETKKHLTKSEIAEKEDMEKEIILGNEQLQEPPTWLINNIATEEWQRIITETNKISIIGNLDLNNLAGYCNAYAMYRKVTKQLIAEPLMIKKLSAGALTKVKNPLVDIQINYANEMRKFASLCGMTIDSRLKAAVIKTNETQEEISDEFGDI